MLVVDGQAQLWVQDGVQLLALQPLMGQVFLRKLLELLCRHQVH